MYSDVVGYLDRGFTWALASLGVVLLAYLGKHVRGTVASGVLTRAWAEVQAAVLEVKQVYVDVIRAGSADGQLTSAEKADAKAKAIATAKANIGVKGVARLARIVGLDGVEKWLTNKVEAAVSLTKIAAAKEASKPAPLAVPAALPPA